MAGLIVAAEVTSRTDRWNWWMELVRLRVCGHADHKD